VLRRWTRRKQREMTARAQSEVTGETLFLAVVVLSVSVFGIAALGTVAVDRPTLVELSETSGDNEYIELSHAGGQSLENESVRIILQDETSSVTLSLTDGEILNQSVQDRFSAGTVWRWDDWESTPLTGAVTVRVLTDDTILLEATKPRPT